MSSRITHLDPEKVVLEFMCKDLLSRDIYVAEESSGDDRSSAGSEHVVKSKLSNRRFQILLFGSTVHGASVTLAVENFAPFFYVRIPNVLAGSASAERNLRTWILQHFPADVASLTRCEVEKHKTLLDYNGGALASFMKITTPSLAAWRAIKKQFLNEKDTTPKTYETKSLFGAAAVPKLRLAPRDCNDYAELAEDGALIALKIYEANIDPVLRFFHTQDVSPAGWISVSAGCWEYTASRDARSDHVTSCDYHDVRAGKGDMAPFLVGSWDIECNSSHGDFPQASKTWRKPVREMFEGHIPSNIDELCSTLADAINGSRGPLSRIYLRRSPAGTMLAETLRLMLVGRDQLTAVETALSALRAAVGTKSEAREAVIKALDDALTSGLPTVAGDEVIQIGTVLYKRGVPVSKHIWVLGTVDESGVKPPGAEVPIDVYSFTDEAVMIKSWFSWVGRMKVDILIGYNIFGFDSQYVWDRLTELLSTPDIELKATAIRGATASITGLERAGADRRSLAEAHRSHKAATEAHRRAVAKLLRPYVAPLSALLSRPPQLEEKFLSSSAMGDNTLYFLSSPGRLQIDLLPYIRRNANLDSYSLDNVSATYVSGGISGALTAVPSTANHFRFGTKSTKGIVVGRYITIMDGENDRVVDRCAVVGVEPKALIVKIEGGAAALAENGGVPVRWAQVKDDVSPKDIFRLHRGSAADRAIVARYCLQDCDLVMELFNKLEVLNNSVAMADVCSVPSSYIFTRGQGIKIESLIFKECRRVDQLIEVLPSSSREEEFEELPPVADEEEEEDSYEGAIVLEPHTGIYLDDPVTADDFASLYPSSIISENISHDTLIWVKDYDNDGNFITLREGSDKYDNIAGEKYVNVEFDILRTDPADTRKHPVKIRDGRRVARYIQSPQGTIPRILDMLLMNRKRVRKIAETEPDEFRRALLDAQQLAYKLTANSLYGQLGSGTFKIRRQVLAASTTAYGRKQLMYAKAVIEEVYGGGKDPRCDVECIYGDTDSIFLRFRPRDPVTGERLSGKEALRVAKELTVESGKLVSSCLKSPHDFEFDKIFRSFILLSKKRYVGDMSEDGIEDEDFHRKSMGIVMKRRDNAPIVKYVYGNVVEKILNATDVGESIRASTEFVHTACKELLAGKFPLSKLTITKSLRANYADPTRIAHKVLADRIGERDPGNKPSTSDRIPFVYISNGAGPTPKLQGDRIELPSYIVEKGLMPDYAFYITNQIAKPVAQMFGLAVEDMPGATPAAIRKTVADTKPVKAREKLAEKLLFEKVLLDAARAPAAMTARGQHSIATLFGAKK